MFCFIVINITIPTSSFVSIYLFSFDFLLGRYTSDIYYINHVYPVRDPLFPPESFSSLYSVWSEVHPPTSTFPFPLGLEELDV